MKHLHEELSERPSELGVLFNGFYDVVLAAQFEIFGHSLLAAVLRTGFRGPNPELFLQALLATHVTTRQDDRFLDGFVDSTSGLSR